MPNELYFDDLVPGQKFCSGPRTVDALQIKAFAGQFDPQPFHLDENAAKYSFFKGLSASGWHTAALTMYLLVTEGLPIAGGLIGAGMDELRWTLPVRPGDSLRIEVEILDLSPYKSRTDRGMLKIRVTTLNQESVPVQVMVSNIIIPRRTK